MFCQLQPTPGLVRSSGLLPLPRAGVPARVLPKSGVNQVILTSYLNSSASRWQGAVELGVHKAGVVRLFQEGFSSPFSLPVYVCSGSTKAGAALACAWMVGASVGDLIWAKLILRLCLMLVKIF